MSLCERGSCWDKLELLLGIFAGVVIDATKNIRWNKTSFQGGTRKILIVVFENLTKIMSFKILMRYLFDLQKTGIIFSSLGARRI